MRQILFLCLLALLLAACEPAAVIELRSGSSLQFDDSHSTQEVAFHASREWTASADAAWIQVSPSSGVAGDAVVSVTVKWNEPEYGPRSGSVLLTCGDAQQRVSVSQAQKDAIQVPQQRVSVKAGGDTLQVEVAHNIPISSVEVDPSCAAWIRPLTTKAMERTMVSFEIDRNEELAGREGKVYISGGGQRLELIVSQPVYELTFTNHGKGFLRYLQRNFDVNHDGVISLAEALLVTELIDVSDSYGIQMENIEYFRNVTIITCGEGCYGIRKLDLRNLHQLRTFAGSADTIDVTGCPELEVLVTSQVSKLDLSNNPNLRILDVGFSDSLHLDVSHNRLLETVSWNNVANEEVDLSGLPYLREVDGHDSFIKRLLVNDCPSLERVHCAEGWKLEKLDVRGCTSLREIDVNTNSLTELDLSGTPHLQQLNIFFNKIAHLDLSGCPELDWFYCAGNRMETLNVQGCTSLRYVECTSNSFSELDFSGCPALDSLACADSKPLTDLNVKGCTQLRYLQCGDAIAHIDLSGNPALEEFRCCFVLEDIDLSHNPALRVVGIASDEITTLDLTHNPLLEEVYCASCRNLKTIYLSHDAYYHVGGDTAVYVGDERVF